MLKGLISTILAVGSMGAPILANEQGQNNSIVQRVVNEPTRAVIYDDNNYNITISDTESNTYLWANFNDFLVENGGDEPVSDWLSYIEYEQYNYSYSSAGLVSGDSSRYYFTYLSVDSGLAITFNDNASFINKFRLKDEDDETQSFGYDMTFHISSSSTYQLVKSAIELDIQANQPSQNTMPSVSDLFGYITQGVTAFIGSLGEAFNSVVALFWTTGTNAGPTFLGLLMLVSIGAGLIFLAYNVIKKLVYRLRG